MNRWIGLLLLFAVLTVGCVAAPGNVNSQRYETGVDSEAWAQVPAGAFWYGAHDQAAQIDYAYEIMLTDVTNAQFALYLDKALSEGRITLTGGQLVGLYPGDSYQGRRHEKRIDAGDYLHVPLGDKDLRVLFDGKRFTAANGYENHPVVSVTWFGAKGYCEYYGWRLPKEMEWEKAARGTDKRAYPWGNEISPTNANYYSSRDPFEKLLGAQGDTTPVGFYNGQAYGEFKTLRSTSPFGLYDMAGNVWQWTGDIHEGTHLRYQRGGSKGTYENDLRVWSRNSAAPDYFGPSTGFRCAR